MTVLSLPTRRGTGRSAELPARLRSRGRLAPCEPLIAGTRGERSAVPYCALTSLATWARTLSRSGRSGGSGSERSAR